MLCCLIRYKGEQGSHENSLKPHKDNYKASPKRTINSDYQFLKSLPSAKTLLHYITGFLMNKQTNELKKRCAAKTSDNDKTKKDTIILTCINLQLDLSVTEAHTLNEEKLCLKDCLLLNPFS